MNAVSTPCVLVVEDEPAQREVLRYNLEKEDYRVITAEDGDDGLLLAIEHTPDLIILDWMLPEVSGIEVCRRLKRNDDTRLIPVMMLTARGEESDKIRGLDTGADDYMVKPYSVQELMARARALIRRSNPGAAGEVMKAGDIVLDTEQHKCTRDGKTIRLGPTEFRLLSVFIARPGRVWGRDQLLARVWPHDLDIDLRTVDVHVGRLRKALKQEGHPDPIRTVRAAGYALEVEGA